MGDILAAIVSFANKVKDDPNLSDVFREAAADLHAEVSKLISGAQPTTEQPQEAPPAEQAPPQPEG